MGFPPGLLPPVIVIVPIGVGHGDEPMTCTIENVPGLIISEGGSDGMTVVVVGVVVVVVEGVVVGGIVVVEEDDEVVVMVVVVLVVVVLEVVDVVG